MITLYHFITISYLTKYVVSGKSLKMAAFQTFPGMLYEIQNIMKTSDNWEKEKLEEEFHELEHLWSMLVRMEEKENHVDVNISEFKAIIKCCLEEIAKIGEKKFEDWKKKISLTIEEREMKKKLEDWILNAEDDEDNYANNLGFKTFDIMRAKYMSIKDVVIRDLIKTYFNNKPTATTGENIAELAKMNWERINGNILDIVEEIMDKHPSFIMDTHSLNEFMNVCVSPLDWVVKPREIEKIIQDLNAKVCKFLNGEKIVEESSFRIRPLPAWTSFKMFMMAEDGKPTYKIHPQEMLSIDTWTYIRRTVRVMLQLYHEDIAEFAARYPNGAKIISPVRVQSGNIMSIYLGYTITLSIIYTYLADRKATLRYQTTTPATIEYDFKNPDVVHQFLYIENKEKVNLSTLASFTKDRTIIQTTPERWEARGGFSGAGEGASSGREAQGPSSGPLGDSADQAQAEASRGGSTMFSKKRKLRDSLKY